MIFKSLLVKLRNKYPKSFRNLSFDALKFINLISFFIFLPIKLFISIFLKIQFFKSDHFEKLIIRNDKIGDCILTLPFIYGSNNQNEFYYFSKFLDKLIYQLNIKCSWKSSNHIKDKSDLLIANLSTSKIINFKEILFKSKSHFIFTQLNTSPFSKRGFPIIFSPNYLINKSQTFFINNCFKLLRIKTNPIEGIRILNNHIKNVSELKDQKIILIVAGYGLDGARKLNNNYIKHIIKYAKIKSLKPIILQEPGFEKNLKRLAQKNGIESKKCNSFCELFILFKNSKFAIGFDCGPMHIASLLTNSIMLFSHTPSSHWGIHCWNEFKYMHHFQKENKKIKVIKQVNKGSNNNNWIICLDNKGCPLHKKICINNYCSEFDESLFEKSLQSILNEDN